MDLVTRLLLNSKQFDDNIKKSSQEIQAMNKKIDGIKQGFSSSFSTITKFAGVFGVAIGAGEALNKTLMSTQTTGDAFVKFQDQAKASVNAFFTSIAMGNFSSFLSGLDDVISKAGDLSVALDNLGTKTLFNNAEYNQLSTKYQLEVNAAKNRNISDAERNKHLEKAKSLMKEMISLRYGLQKANEEAAYSALQSDVSKQGFHQNVKKETWEYLLKDSNRSKVENSASKYKQWDSRISDSQDFDTNSGMRIDTRETLKIKKEFDKYLKTARGKYEQLAYIFLEMDDDEKSAIANAVKMRESANNIAIDISSKQLEINNAEAKINGGFNKKNKAGKSSNSNKAAEEILPEGSIANFQKQITDATKEFTNATTDAARIAIQKKIDELKEVIRIMDFKATNPSLPILNSANGDMSGKSSLKVTATNPGAGLNVKGFGNLGKQMKELNGSTSDWADSVNAVTGAMVTLNTAIGDGEKNWLTFAATSGGAIAQMILQLQALATAKGVTSAAELPFPASLAAIATVVATVASVFSALPKFTEGGIVSGSSFSGDNVLARVNSGEMILNGYQQHNLFSLLNSSTPSASQVEFRLRGQELVGLIKNYNNKRNKLR